jgi:hypothetical protein
MKCYLSGEFPPVGKWLDLENESFAKKNIFQKNK